MGNASFGFDKRVTLMADRIGTVLDSKYELVRLIGEGGMGSVFEANHKLIGRKLAVKFLHPQYASSDEVVTRFQREAQAAAQIGHENIIEVTDMGTDDDDSPYLVMEFLQGCDVKRLIEAEGIQTPKRAAHIMVQALSALQAAHDVGIIHRDLKPENIYLIEKGGNPDYVKLLDFGISKFRALETDGAKGLTQTGTVLGTPHYMSPEQARGEQDLTPMSDIYAMGVILYQMLTGELPFDAPNYNALLIKILTEEPDPPNHINPDLPEELVKTIETAMARNAQDRFETCDDFRGHLLQFAPDSSSIGNMSSASRTVIRKALYSSKTPFEMTQSGIEGRNSKKIPIIIGGAVAAVAALVVGGFFIFGGEPGKPEIDPVPVDIPVRVSEPVVQDETGKDDGGTEETGESPNAVATVQLNISAVPSDAVIKIDGADVGANPFEGPFARSEMMRNVEVTAQGYESVNELVSFNADVVLSYTLKKIKAAKKRDSGKLKHKEKEVVAPPVKPTKSGKTKTRKIDYDDPWNQ